MRQKDLNHVASILAREVYFATSDELAGLNAAIGAIKADVAYRDPGLDTSPLDHALEGRAVLEGYVPVLECSFAKLSCPDVSDADVCRCVLPKGHDGVHLCRHDSARTPRPVPRLPDPRIPAVP